MDLIRSGKAPEVIRRKGAEGNLPLPAEDKIEILTLLAAAPEADLREKALETLQGWDRAEVRRVMASPQTAPEVLRFAAEQLVAGARRTAGNTALEPQPSGRIPRACCNASRPAQPAVTQAAELARPARLRRNLSSAAPPPEAGQTAKDGFREPTSGACSEPAEEEAAD